MRSLVRKSCVFIAIFFLAPAPVLIMNSWELHHSNELLKTLSNNDLSLSQRLLLYRTEHQLYQKAHRYIQTIESQFLVKGMVVNRDLHDNAMHTCDSLLFTSLYYVSLKKLGYESLATKAWQAITQSFQDGRWLRHPECTNPTSRDMIVGVLAAFSQGAPKTKTLLTQTLNYITANRGFFSPGRPDIAFLTPGIGELMRIYNHAVDLENVNLPRMVTYGFSTSAFSTLVAKPGYRSHLVGLQAWIEMEMRADKTFQEAIGDHRHVIKLYDPWSALTPRRISDLRLSWITHKIAENHPDNLFFRYLRLKAAKAYGPEARLSLMHELLTMEQFPHNRPPSNCDRKADFLWQRHSGEYESISAECSKFYHGVDFLWMVSLLTEFDELMAAQ